MNAMRWMMALVVLLGPLSATAQDIPLGSVVPPYPEGTSGQMGLCVAGAKADDCQWLIGVLRSAKTTPDRVFAAKYLDKSGGNQRWRIFDIRVAPPLLRNQMWATEACMSSRAVAEQGALGIVAYADRGGWIEAQRTVWAVTLDVASQKLVELSPADVTCVLPGS